MLVLLNCKLDSVLLCCCLRGRSRCHYAIVCAASGNVRYSTCLRLSIIGLILRSHWQRAAPSLGRDARGNNLRGPHCHCIGYRVADRYTVRLANVIARHGSRCGGIGILLSLTSGWQVQVSFTSVCGHVNSRWMWHEIKLFIMVM